jgi:hypothetical protein
MSKRRFALAFLLAATLVLGHAVRVPATPARHGLQLRVVTGMAERLAVRPVGIVVTADALEGRAGGNGALGRVLLADQTRRPVTLRLRALPSAHDLDDTLEAAITVDGMPIARTTLGRLRAGTAPITLQPGRPAELGVRLWLPEGTPRGAYVGRTLDVVLELRTEPVITR